MIIADGQGRLSAFARAIILAIRSGIELRPIAGLGNHRLRQHRCCDDVRKKAAAKSLRHDIGSAPFAFAWRLRVREHRSRQILCKRFADPLGSWG